MTLEWRSAALASFLLSRSGRSPCAVRCWLSRQRIAPAVGRRLAALGIALADAHAPTLTPAPCLTSGSFFRIDGSAARVVPDFPAPVETIASERSTTALCGVAAGGGGGVLVLDELPPQAPRATVVVSRSPVASVRAVITH